MKKLIFLLPLIVCIFFECKKDTTIIVPPIEQLPSGATVMKSSPQRSGDVTKGFQYLTEGDFLNSGIPFATFKAVFGTSNPDDLGRTGDNKGIAYNYTVSTTTEGVKVVSQNCFSCHATKINGKLVLGVGNNMSDNSQDQTVTLNQLEAVIKLQFGGTASPEWKAYETYGKALRAIAPGVITQTLGANPADKIFAALSAHRNATDLSWINTPQYSVPNEVIHTDVPAWWLMKKKNVLYYNGLGQGDYARLVMASSLLTMKDSTDAAKIDNRFADVISYMKTIEAPKYPFATDANLIAAGKKVFEENCAKCHGTYGSNVTYPNYLIDLQAIKTDATLATLYKAYPDYNTWYNKSWFNKGKYAAQLNPQNGYIAPPLDGVWATAPYLHNGSVPTIEDLLNSTQRPAIWRYTKTDNSDYDEAKIGWKYTVVPKKADLQTFDTSLKGYSNTGHYYGDSLTKEERKAILEYLKTL
jgi:mono/diheme cytochrome c family protein